MYAITCLQAMGSVRMDFPATVISPASKRRMPQQDFSVVVFPAPLWPMKP